MLSRLSNRIEQAASARSIAVALALMLVFTTVLLPRADERRRELTGDMELLDTRFGYSAEEAYREIGGYGSAGRQAYRQFIWTVDLAFPLMSAALYMLVISAALRNLLPAGSGWRRLNLLPLITMAMDYGENFSVDLLLARYPEEVAWAAALASIFTRLKWLAVGLVSTVAVISLAAWAVNRLRR